MSKIIKINTTYLWYKAFFVRLLYLVLQNVSSIAWSSLVRDKTFLQEEKTDSGKSRTRDATI